MDTTQAGTTGGSCVKFEYGDKGNGKATISGGVIEGILGNKAGQYTVRARVKVTSTTSTTPIFVLSMQNLNTMTIFERYKGAGEPSNEQVMFSPSQMKTEWNWVELPFYWDGIQPIELWTGRRGGYEPDLVFWEDKVEFVSMD
ncbi:hypothetical protein GRF59_15220 [Paenibacillus sp. HJL G12]|uniref:Uncharacterized protein n=1 Tax=Paenibacillus dendrobii TaxID=2691084 RepID=A0A7X3IMU7_9BACL|nr:hypothetical protein [Paenibacillus dendrobii]MWV44972.1 hypothetical protein [Paenibacillus dendrobii]